MPQRTRTFYKLTSQQSLFPQNNLMAQWDGIATSGLDPSFAGKNHLGATSSAKSTGRNETGLDRGQTWLSSVKGTAYSYRSHVKSNPRMLKIELPEHWANRHVVDRGQSNFTTDQFISRNHISVKTAHGDGENPSIYTPLNALRRRDFIGYDSDSEYDSGDDGW